MARPSVSREEIFKICAEMWQQEGKEPSAVSVRSRLGRGSMNTIHDVVVEWRQMRDAGTYDELPMMDEEFIATWTRLGEEAWRLLMGRAEREKARFREQSERDLKRFREEAEEATQIASSMEKDLETALDDRESLEREVLDLRTKLAIVEAAVGEARATATNERRQRETLNDRVQELSDDLQEERVKGALMAERASQLERRLEDTTPELTAARKRIETLVESKEAALKNEVRYEHTIEALSNELQEFKDVHEEEIERSNRLQQEIEDLSTARGQAEAALQEVRRHVEHLDQQNKELAAELRSVRDEASVRSERSQSQIEELAAARARAEAALEEVRRHLAHLQGAGVEEA